MCVCTCECVHVCAFHVYERSCISVISWLTFLIEYCMGKWTEYIFLIAKNERNISILKGTLFIMSHNNVFIQGKNFHHWSYKNQKNGKKIQSTNFQFQHCFSKSHQWYKLETAWIITLCRTLMSFWQNLEICYSRFHVSHWRFYLF